MISKLELIGALKKASTRAMDLLSKIEESDEVLKEGSVVSGPTLVADKPMYPTSFQIRLNEEGVSNCLTKILYVEVPYLETPCLDADYQIRTKDTVKIMIRGGDFNSLTYIGNPDCIPGFSVKGDLYIDVENVHDPSELIISVILRILYFLKDMNSDESPPKDFYPFIY